MTYLQANSELTPQQILKSIGKSDVNWYVWQQKPLFKQWWSMACADAMKATVLPQVHKAIARRALTDSSADAKLFLERFDQEYKPTTKQEIDMVADLARPDALELSRQKLDNLLQNSNQSPQIRDANIDKT